MRDHVQQLTGQRRHATGDALVGIQMHELRVRARQHDYRRFGDGETRDQAHRLDLFATHHVHRLDVVQAEVIHRIAHARHKPDRLGAHLGDARLHHAGSQIAQAGRRHQVRHFVQADIGGDHAGRQHEVDLVDDEAGLLQRGFDSVLHAALQRRLVAGDGGVAHPDLARGLAECNVITPHRDARVGGTGVDGEDVHAWHCLGVTKDMAQG